MALPEQRCYKCKKVKPLSDFYPCSKRKSGRQTMCKSCRSEYAREYRKIPKNRLRLNTNMHKWHLTHVEHERQRGREYNKQLKLHVLQKISGLTNPHCAKCGCDDPRCLEINHKNGGGCKEYRQVPPNASYKRHSAIRFYRAILSGERDISDLEVLCRVCNNLDYLQRKYGKLPYEIIWGGSTR